MFLLPVTRVRPILETEGRERSPFVAPMFLSKTEKEFKQTKYELEGGFISKHGAGEAAQPLRAFAALAEAKSEAKRS